MCVRFFLWSCGLCMYTNKGIPLCVVSLYVGTPTKVYAEFLQTNTLIFFHSCPFVFPILRSLLHTSIQIPTSLSLTPLSCGSAAFHRLRLQHHPTLSVSPQVIPYPAHICFIVGQDVHGLFIETSRVPRVAS